MMENVYHGLGFDIHRLKKNRNRAESLLRLGGFSFPSGYSFVAHSDGDLIIHALVDSLAPAILGKDIGELFPDTAPENKGRQSTGILSETLALLRPYETRYIQFDIILCTDLIKIMPLKKGIISSLGQFFPEAVISVKGKTTEKGLKKNYCYCWVSSVFKFRKPE